MSKEGELLKKILTTGWLNHELSCEVEAILAQPEQEPLTDYATYDMFRASKQAVNASCYWSGVRDAEKAHGIGVNDEISITK